LYQLPRPIQVSLDNVITTVTSSQTYDVTAPLDQEDLVSILCRFFNKLERMGEYSEPGGPLGRAVTKKLVA